MHRPAPASERPPPARRKPFTTRHRAGPVASAPRYRIVAAWSKLVWVNLACAASVALLLTACRSTPPSETAELRQAMRQQMNAQREQLKASGATATQLRDYDRAMEQMDQAMRQIDKQMRSLERKLDQLPE